MRRKHYTYRFLTDKGEEINLVSEIILNARQIGAVEKALNISR